GAVRPGKIGVAPGVGQVVPGNPQRSIQVTPPVSVVSVVSHSRAANSSGQALNAGPGTGVQVTSSGFWSLSPVSSLRSLVCSYHGVEEDLIMKLDYLVRALCGALALTVAGAASAQAVYPAKPVRFIVPSSAGGGTDIVARILSPKMS